MDLIRFCSLLLVSFLLLKWLRRKLRPSLSLPPGPKGYPIIGNMLDIPSVMPWKKFQEWSKVYGDVLFLNLPGQPTVILGSAKAAFDLLDKRSDIYSDRPTPIMHKMMSWGWNLALMPYSQRWRDHRREFHQHFNQHEVPKFHQIQLRECRAFLQRVFASPTNDLGQNVRQIFTAIILKIAYDMDISDLRDEYVLLAQEAVEGISIVTVPGICWLEHFPFLRYIPTWVPWTYSKRITEYYRPIVENMVNKPFDEIKQGIVNGQDNHSLVSSIIERIQQRSIEDPSNPIDDKIARNVAGVAYATAADTTTSAGQSFLVAMSLYPDVQRKAQEELDRVVGPNRLPDFEDYHELLYIKAVLLEAMRWMVVVPLSLPHRVIRDDEYKGYIIPEGTIVNPNIWAMLHDPEDYPEPERFNPDRFLKDGKLNPDVRDPLTLAFGFGRRVCPGRHLSDGSLFMMIASVLHTFDIHPVIDEDGKEYDPTSEVITGLISAPERIPCRLTPRSKNAEELIRQLSTT